MATTRIELTEKAKETLRKLQTLPEWGLRAVAKGLKAENQQTVGKIQKDHLTGKGPFPPEMHKLGVRSGRLRGALWASEPTIKGQMVESAIGDNVVYAAIHEFGGRIVRKPHQRTLRFKTVRSAGRKEKLDKRGNVIQSYEAESRRLAKQGKGGNLWVFAKRTDTHAEETSVNVGEYTIDVPERAPVRTGIQERLQDYGRMISRELVAAWGENQ